MSVRLHGSWLVVVSLGVACGGVPTPSEDSGLPDASMTVDSGLPDAGSLADAGEDAGASDDAGLPDAGLPDAGVPDAGVPDAGPPDAGTTDGGDADAGDGDAGTPVGLPCTDAADCVTGFCADGVCCETGCAGTCESCAQAGRAGFCDPIPTGTDPDGECPTQPVSSCGTTGACSGNRACALYPAGTECAAASCSAATSTLADTCNGLGVCVDNGTATCVPFACDTAAGQCRATCASSGDCASGYACAAGGLCKKAQGQACTAAAECASGFCVDGACCDSACTGTCERCDQGGRVGTCDPVPAGQDPDNECAATPASTCGTTGLCSGVRTCALHSSGTICASASCGTGGGSSQSADQCDGLGTCVDSGSVSCGSYLCNPATGLCRTTCSVSTDCANGFSCAAGLCKRSVGAACTLGTECASGFCTDGVCCSNSCSGLCERCNQAGSVGTCTAVPSGQDPDNECAATPASTCGTTGVCSGVRTCALYPSGTVCAAASCGGGGGSSQPADLCNGAGTCVDSGSVSCGFYLCNPATGLCRTNCGTSADCASGRTCSGGTCQ